MRSIPILRRLFSLLLGLVVATLVRTATLYAQDSGGMALQPAAIADEASNVRLLGHIGGPLNVVTVADNRAYVSEGRSITILDVTHPATPTVLGRIAPLPAIIRALVVQNQHLYVATGADGLHIFDVSDPARTLRVGYYDTPGDAFGVFVLGDFAYVADGTGGLRVIHVANPATTSESGFFDTPGLAKDVYVVGTIAYVADDDQGLRLLNVANPANILSLGTFDTPGHAVAVQVVGNYAYIGNLNGGLRIVDVTNPSLPRGAGFCEYSVEHCKNLSWVEDIFVVGHLVYAAEFDAGLYVIDASNPITPTELGSFYVREGIEDVYVVGNHAYVADWDGRLWAVDITDSTTPKAVGFYSAPRRVDAVHVASNYAYVASGSDGLHVVDVANPFLPNKVGFFDGSKFPDDVFVVGKYAYVTGYEDNLRVVDVSNPFSPTQVGSALAGTSNHYVYVSGNYAYLADTVFGSGGFMIVDITNPLQPINLATYDAPGTVGDIFVVDKYAYLATSDYIFNQPSGLRILDVSNPNAPMEIGAVAMLTNATGVHVVGNFAYVANGEAGLSVVNIATPETPSVVGSIDTPSSAMDVYVVGTLAYVADYRGGLRVINVATPSAPKEVGSYVTPDAARRVYVNGNVIYLATAEGGLYLLRYPNCYRLTLQYTGLGAIPTTNPTNSPGCATGEYLPQTFITLNANPATGWRVGGWLGTDNDERTSRTNSLTMFAADHEVTVRYAPTCYALTLTHTGTGSPPTASPAQSEGCSVGQYVAGQTITLTAAAGAGYVVGSWSNTANDTSIANQNMLTMPAIAHTAGVNYVQGCYGLTLSHTGSGGDPVATPGQAIGCAVGNYHFGDTITLSASPATGWLVNAWSGTINNSISATTNSLLMPAGNHAAAVHYGEVPVTTRTGDLFELDNSCTRSRPIATDGSEVQSHTFHVAGDNDWIRFDAANATAYRIEVTVPATSTADVVLEVYPDCSSSASDHWSGNFSPGARLDFSRTVGGPTYVRLTHIDANSGDETMQYEVNVRKLGEPPANRALIIVAGRLKLNDRVQNNIDNVAKNVYQLYQRNGYNDASITLLASNSTLPGWDGAASRAALQAALQNAASKVVNGVLTLYLVDHGTPELFYIDEVNQQRMTPNDLHDWLSQLEAAAPGVKINVIIEACESGSFIDKPGSISKSGRVVVTSSNAVNDAKASKDGAYFSDHLLTWMQQGYNLSASFFEARTAAKNIYVLQDAWLDSNGNGIANEFDDSAAAAQRSFAYAGTLADSEWPPHIFEAKAVGPVNEQQVRLRVDVRDNGGVRQVWVVVYEPGYTPPVASQELQPEVLPTQLFQRVDNDNHWEAQVTGLSKPGIYRLLIHADDEQGLVARPVVIEVNTAPNTGKTVSIFLPLVTK